MFDTDGSGTIDASELGAALKAMGHELSEAELKQMLAQADDDGTGEIEFEEFCALMGIEIPAKPDSSAQLPAAGEEGDKNEPGPTAKQPRQEKMPKKAADPNEKVDPHAILSEQEIKEMKEIFELFDEDRSGFIDMEELGKMMVTGKLCSMCWTTKCQRTDDDISSTRMAWDVPSRMPSFARWWPTWTWMAQARSTLTSF